MIRILTWALLDSPIGRAVGWALGGVAAVLALLAIGARIERGRATARQQRRTIDAYQDRERIDADVAQETDLVFRARRSGSVRPGP